MTDLMDALETRWNDAHTNSEETIVDTETFLKSALSLTRHLESYSESEEFDEEFLALCQQCKSGILIHDL